MKGIGERKDLGMGLPGEEGMRFWCLLPGRWVTFPQPQVDVGGRLGFGCPLFHLAELLAKLILADKT